MTVTASWRRMRSRQLLPLLLAAALLLPGAAVAAERLSGTVTWVYDGDTLQIAGVGKVRLLGIDTPEKQDSTRDQSFHRLGGNPRTLRAAGRAARRFNQRLAKGQLVHLSYDAETRDRHGRLLAYVTLPDGRLLNRLLLDEGLAIVYRRFDFLRKEEFLAAEAAARRQQRGIWAP